MNIKDLTHDQQLALVALLEAVAVADRQVSEGEEAEIGRVADALGEESYRSLLDEAEARFKNEASLKAFLKTISDREVREFICGMVAEETRQDISPQRVIRDPSDWLAAVWGIDVRIEPE